MTLFWRSLLMMYWIKCFYGQKIDFLHPTCSAPEDMEFLKNELSILRGKSQEHEKNMEILKNELNVFKKTVEEVSEIKETIQQLSSTQTTTGRRINRPIATCEKGWVTYQRGCYFFSTTIATFREAMSACYQMGAEMLELQNSMEEKWFDNQVRLRGHSPQVWLGASDTQQEGKFISVSKAEGLPYSHWLKGQPSNLGGEEHCLTYWVSLKGMNDAPCDNKYNYVCKK
ncbi:perlucin-like isoform X2 [Saccostrea cucullata]|uniref:perlucin-like isoform X2 n=1 Tax=Saccostrea cuccullata TaxID=36930 RepID=UPI002ED22775